MFALAACTAHPAEPPVPADSLPAGIQVELFQLRSDVAERGAQVRVINDSDTDLVITSLTFADDWFSGPAVRDRTSTIPAGRTVDLRVGLPESACEDEPDAASRTSRVTLELQGGGSATVDVADPSAGWRYAHWLVSHASDTGLERVRFANLEWHATEGKWQPVTADGGADERKVIASVFR
jgi:hypothetical protein